MKKIKLAILWGIITSVLLVNCAFAATNEQLVTDQAESFQATTQQSPEEIQVAAEKSKQAQILIDSINKYKSNAIGKDELDKVVKNYNEKYNTEIDSDKVLGLQPTSNTKTMSKLSVSSTATDYLGFLCMRQLKDWYCGPASACILINGMGSVLQGRSITQDNLASDLGAETQGAIFPGAWTTTLKNWTSKTYAAVWGPSTTTLLNYAYVDTVSGMGSIYDTYMSGDNQLYGYARGSARYHYVAGDGYDNTNSKVHYLDPHNTNNTAYGVHWVSASTMANCVSSRGMVW